MKRFWSSAVAEEREGQATILLDGRPMRLPGGPVLTLPVGAMADAIAQEWQDAGGGIDGLVLPDALPLTRLAGTAQTRIAADPGPTIDAIARYGETDLLCYRAPMPPALAARQALLWQPWLEWADTRFDARLVAHAGVMHHPQSPHALAMLQKAVAASTPWRLAGLGVAVPALGSLVLGLALAERRIEPDDAHALALLDELFEAESWGRDAEAEARRAHISQDIADAGRFMRLAES